MFDRFGAPRVDDEVVSTKQHQLVHQEAASVSTSTISDLYINTTSEIVSGRTSDSRIKPNKTTTPPPSRRESRAYATEWSEQKNIITTTATATAKQISENIRTIAELAFGGCHEQLHQHHQQQQQNHQSLPKTPPREATSPRAGPSTSTASSSSTYQLRALTGNKIEEEEEGKESRHCLNKRLSADSLSLKLIEETLTYFISCKQRLSQITKTFDDSNALIMLLQEKEEDLEVVGQLGQDLLRRYNELKEAYEGQRQELARFQEELAKCREDNQQLKYDLASNKSLLDTFKEEEEHQLDQQNTSAGLRVCSQCQADEEGQTYSLRSQADRSLTYLENELYKQMCELKDELMEVRERELNQKLQEQERNLELEVQLRDNERRQTDLEGENESLRDQHRELQQVIETQSRRFDELLGIFSEYQREARAHYLNNGATSNNNNISFNYLTESSPSFDSQLDSLLFLHQPHHVQYQDTQLNQQQQPLPSTPISPTTQQQQNHNQQIVRPIVRKSSSSNLVTSTSLHEELLESMHKTRVFPESDDDDDQVDDEVQNARELDGADSGLHTRNISTSTTPVNSAGTSCLDTDSDDATATIVTNSSSSGRSTACLTTTGSPLDPNNNSTNEAAAAAIDDNNNLSKRLSCLGLSTFTLTTLLLLCLSATFNSTTNSNLAQKLQQINLNQ